MRFTLFSALSILCLFFCCCKTIQATKPLPASALTSQTPMSCRITGTIIGIVKNLDNDTGSICSRYPCRARVRIKDVSDCGSSVSFTINSGDTVEMKFFYTLENTSKVLPSMKAHYPGLKKSDNFMANTEQRIKTGGGEFVVYGYQLINMAN